MNNYIPELYVDAIIYPRLKHNPVSWISFFKYKENNGIRAQNYKNMRVAGEINNDIRILKATIPINIYRFSSKR